MFLKYLKENKLFISAIALIHIVFFLLAYHFKRIYMGDSSEYIYESLNIKNLFFFYSGNPALPIDPELMTQRQPAYPLFLLLIYFVTVNNWLVLVFQNILSVLNVLYCRKIFRNVGLKSNYDWLLLIMLVAYPSQFINASTIAPDILLQTFTLLYLGNFIALIQKKERKYAVGMGLALIVGMMVKPVLYPFVIINFLIVTIIGIYQKAKLQRTIVIALMPVIAVLMYNYWNYTRTDKFHFSSNQAFNAVYYYYPFIGSKYGADSAEHFLKKERFTLSTIPEYKDRYDYANQQGLQLLKENFWSYSLFHIKNTLRIFIEPGKGELDLFTGKLTYRKLYSKEQTGFYATINKKGWGSLSAYFADNSSMIFVIIILIFNLIKVFGLLLFFKDYHISPPVKIIIAILLVYFSILAGPIANTRYFLPVSLIAIFAAILGLTRLIEKKKSSV